MNLVLEERSKFLDDKNVSHLIGCHPRLAEYTKIIEIPRSVLQEEMNTYSVSSDIVTKNFFDRLTFLLSKPGNPNMTIKHRPDTLLLLCKALLHYKWYLGWKQGPFLQLNAKVQYLSERKAPVSHGLTHLLKSVEEFKTQEAAAQSKLATEYKDQANKCKVVVLAEVQKLAVITDWVAGVCYTAMQKVVDGVNQDVPHMLMLAGLLEPLLANNFFDNPDKSVVGFAVILGMRQCSDRVPSRRKESLFQRRNSHVLLCRVSDLLAQTDTGAQVGHQSCEEK